jgi:hypothetical protein
MKVDFAHCSLIPGSILFGRSLYHCAPGPQALGSASEVMHLLHTKIAGTVPFRDRSDCTPQRRKNFARFSGNRVLLAAHFFAIAQLRHQTVG